MGKLNDLEVERSYVSFDVEEFTKWYYGGEKNVAKKKFFGNK
jgi:hypothetical protein